MGNKSVNIIVTAVDKASKTLSGIGDRFSSIASKVADVSKVVGGVGVGLGAYGLKIAGDMEQTRVSFETMLGSADKARKLLGELSDFAATTPFEFPEIAQAGKSLLAFGFASQDIQKNLTMLGDIASGLNIPFGELSDIYGKIRVQGRLYAEDINQLTGRGIPIIGELAKQFGVSESEVKKLVEAGKIGFPEIQTAFQNLTKEGSQFGGMMEKQSKTLNGQLSTLTDNLKNSLMNLIGINKQGDVEKGSIFEKITIAVGDLNKQIEQNGPKIKEYFDSFLKVLEGGITIIKETTKLLLKLGGAIGYLASEVAIKGEQINKNFDNTLKTVLTDLKKSEGEIGPVAQKWGLNLVTMMASGMRSEIIEAKSKGIAGIIADYLGFHSPTKKGPGSDGDTWMPNLIKMLSDGLYKGYTDIDRASAKIATAISGQIKGMNLDFLKTKLSEIKENALTAFDEIKYKISDQKESVKSLVEDYKDLKTQLSDINKTITGVKAEGSTNVAERLVVIEKEIQENIEKRSGKNNDLTREEAKQLDQKIIQLQTELELAKANTSNIEIQKAREEAVKSETQKIIDRMNLKLKEANEEKQRITDLMTAKRTQIESEYNNYKTLVQTKLDIDKYYFELFDQRIRTSQDNIKRTITQMQSLVNMTSSSGTSTVTGKKAVGGSVAGGEAYLVGENGPEIFRPLGAGKIIPNGQIGGGGTVININLGGVVVQKEADENRLVEKIKQTIYKEFYLAKLT